MNRDDFQRFEYLSEKSKNGEPTVEELSELQQLMKLWNETVQSQCQLSSVNNDQP